MMFSMPRVAIPPLRLGQSGASSGASWLAPSSLRNRSKSLPFLAKQVRGCRDAMPHKAASHALILPPQQVVGSLTLEMPRSWPRLRAPRANATVALPSPASRASPRLPLDCPGERVVGGCVLMSPSPARSESRSLSCLTVCQVRAIGGARHSQVRPAAPATAPLASL
jgi:hypothetical protein